LVNFFGFEKNKKKQKKQKKQKLVEKNHNFAKL